MILLKRLRIQSKNKEEITVDFGTPDNPTEMEDMFKLRYGVYSKRKYIKTEKYQQASEKDEYDINGKCTYFIAKCNDKIIATIRLIKDQVLPTEKSFSFEEPEKMSFIERDRRAELGRFIIIPATECGIGCYLPRGIIMLLMFNALSEYGMQNNIRGGYCFIKKKLEEKMSKRKFPFYKIGDYKLKVDENDVLYNYFSSKDNPVVPIYYITQDFFEHTKRILNNKLIFKNIGNDIFLKNNIYTRFLRLFNVI